MTQVNSVLLRQLDHMHRLLRENAASQPGIGPVYGDSVNLPDIYYVDSGNGNDGNDGRDPAFPKATIDAAISVCTASQGDVVLVQPGHVETLTALIALDIIGVSVIGVGEGTLRPQLTINAVIDGISVTAANCLVENIGYVVSSLGATSQINVAAANCTLRRIHFDIGASDLLGTITVTADGEILTVEQCSVRVTADGPDEWILVEGVVDQLLIQDNYVVGSDGSNPFDEAIIQLGSVAVTNLTVRRNSFLGGGQPLVAVAGTGSFVGLSIGQNDYLGGCIQGISSGQPEPAQVMRSIASKVISLDGAQADLFVVTGAVQVLSIVGVVTTAIPSESIDLSLRVKATVALLCIATVADGDVVGTVYTVTSTVGDTLCGGIAPDAGHAALAGDNGVFIVNGDTIELLVAGGGTGGTGVINWTILYIPLDDNAVVRAA